MTESREGLCFSPKNHSRGRRGEKKGNSKRKVKASSQKTEEGIRASSQNSPKKGGEGIHMIARGEESIEVHQGGQAELDK